MADGAAVLASDNLDFSIEEWHGDRLVTVLARAGHIHVATAAYWVAVTIRPKSTIRLCKGAMIVRERTAPR